jgi:hypothetical protein
MDIIIVIGVCLSIITAFGCAGFMLWVGAKIYYQGTLQANPIVLRSTKMEKEVSELTDEDLEGDPFEIDPDGD